jgi:hypothetical protein
MQNESIILKRELKLTLYYKAINQVSVQQLQRWQRKVWKTEKLLKFLLSSGGITLAKRELDL